MTNTEVKFEILYKFIFLTFCFVSSKGFKCSLRNKHRNKRKSVCMNETNKLLKKRFKFILVQTCFASALKLKSLILRSRYKPNSRTKPTSILGAEILFSMPFNVLVLIKAKANNTKFNHILREQTKSIEVHIVSWSVEILDIASNTKVVRTKARKNEIEKKTTGSDWNMFGSVPTVRPRHFA